MRYKYNLFLFYVLQHTSEESLHRPAALFSQQNDVPFISKLTDIQVFNTGDELFSWLKGLEIISSTDLGRVGQDFRRSNKFAQLELCIPHEHIAKLTPPLSPEPGEVVPSEEFLKKITGLKAGE